MSERLKQTFLTEEEYLAQNPEPAPPPPEAAPAPAPAPPPEAAPPPDQDAALQQVFTDEAAANPQAAPPAQAATTAPPAPPPPGPASGIGGAIGGFLDKASTAASQYVPQPVKQEIGGRLSGAAEALDVVGQDVVAAGDAAARGDIGGVGGAALDLLNAPAQRGQEELEARALEGKGYLPSPAEVMADPSQLIGGAVGAYQTWITDQPLISDQPFEEWVRTHRDEAQAARDARPGGAYDLWQEQQGFYDGTLGGFGRGFVSDLGTDPLFLGELATLPLTGGLGLAGKAAMAAGHPGLARTLGTAAKGIGRSVNVTDTVFDPLGHTIGAALEPAAGKVAKATKGLFDLSEGEKIRLGKERISDVTSAYLPTSPLRTATPPSSATTSALPARGVTSTSVGTAVPSPATGQPGSAASSLVRESTQQSMDALPPLDPVSPTTGRPLANGATPEPPTPNMTPRTGDIYEIPKSVGKQPAPPPESAPPRPDPPQTYDPAAPPGAGGRPLRLDEWTSAFGGLSDARAAKMIEALPDEALLDEHFVPVSLADDLRLRERVEVNFGRGKRTMVVREALDEAQRDVEDWVQMAADPQAREAKRWRELNERFAESGIDPQSLAGEQHSRLRDQLAQRHVEEAFDRANPVKPGQFSENPIAQLNRGFLTFRKRVGLFNYVNTPRYITQNLLGNTLTDTLTGHITTAFKPFDLRRWPGIKKQLATAGSWSTLTDDMQRKIGVGFASNVAQQDRAALGAMARGTTPKGGPLAKILAPDWLIHWAQAPDILRRQALFEEALTDGFRELNRTLPERTAYWGRHYGLPYTERQWKEGTAEFLNRNRTIIDANTGQPHTALGGRIAKYEPMWSASDFSDFVRDEMPKMFPDNPTPDARQMSLLSRRVEADNVNAIKTVRDTAVASMERIAFDFRQMTADEIISNFTMFHYWTTRQGGLYARLGMSHPAAIAAYGRAMQEFGNEIEQMDGPDWMKGWLRFMNSPAGLSVWYSLPDLFSSVLTFADWQMSSDPDPFGKLSNLGEARAKLPLALNPLLDLLAYGMGFYGDPGTNVPDVLGLNRTATTFIDLINVANTHGMLPEWVNAAGVGVDALGNKVMIPTKPLAQLYATVGSRMNEALKSVTGAAPIPIPNMMGTTDRHITTQIEQNLRVAYPGMPIEEVQRRANDILRDHGSPEYQQALREITELPYATSAGVPGVVSGAARLASPIQVRAYPETRVTEEMMKGGVPGFADTVPPMTSSVPDDAATTDKNENAEAMADARRLRSATPATRILSAAVEDYYLATDPDAIGKVNGIVGSLHAGAAREDVTIGGVTYTPDEFNNLDYRTQHALADQWLSEQGVSQEQITALKDGRAAYREAHPEVDAFLDWQQGAYAKDDNYDPIWPGATDEERKLNYIGALMGQNPAYADYVMTNAVKEGKIIPSWALDEGGYLAAQGRPDSVYSRLDMPSTGVAPVPEPLGQTKAVPLTDLNVRATPGGEIIAGVGAGTRLTVVAPGRDWTQVMIPGPNGLQDGWVATEFIQNERPPVTPPMPPGSPAPVTPEVAGQLGGYTPTAPQPPPGEGLIGMAGGIGNALGGVATGIGDAFGTLTGHNAGQPTKPGYTSVPGYTDLSVASDGIGIQSTPDSDRGWMEMMIGPNQAAVSTDYKQAVTWNVDYSYQLGHGADAAHHAAYDITCDDPQGRCVGTPMTVPKAGRVVCAGYGAGTGEAIGSPNCTYSAGTTLPGQAHTIVIDVGTDVAGNPVQLSFNHMGESAVTPGQMVNMGDPLGTMGDTDAGPHVHLEGWVYSPQLGTYQIVDPQLIMSGYFDQHSVDEQ